MSKRIVSIAFYASAIFGAGAAIAVPLSPILLQGNYIYTAAGVGGTLGMGGNTSPGIQYDPTGTKTFDPNKDYLTPGTPFEGFSVNSATLGLQHLNNDAGSSSTTGWGSMSLTNENGITYNGVKLDNRAVWQGTYSSAGGSYTVVNDVGFNNNDKMVAIRTTITANSALSGVQFLRVIDPDPSTWITSNYSTLNTQGITGKIPANSVVVSQGQDAGGNPIGQYIGYYTNSATTHNTGVSAGWSTTPANYLTGATDGTGDYTIGLAFDLGNLTTGQQLTFLYYYFFTNDLNLFADTVGGGIFVPHASSRSSGAATVMDALNGAAGTNASMQAALTTGAALSAGQKSALLERLIPMNGRGTPMAAYTNFDATLDAVDLRVSGLALGSLVATAKPRPIILAALGSPSGLIDEMGDRTDNSKTFWVRALGHDGRQGQYNGFAGFHSQAGGLAFGSDVDLGNRWVLGGAFSAARGTVDFADLRTGDNSSVDSVQLTGYTTKNLGDLYVHGTLGYAQHSFATNRNTTLTGVAHGDFRGNQWGARIGAAWPKKLTKATVTPAVSLDYSHLSVPGYVEFGAGATSLNVNAQTIERLRSRIGGRVSTQLDSQSDLVFRPVLHLYWVHDFKSQTPQLSANFVGGGPAFLTPSQPLPQDTASLGASLVISKGSDFTSEIRYGLDLARSYSGQSVSAMARWLF